LTGGTDEKAELPAISGSFSQNTGIALISAAFFHVIWQIIILLPWQTGGGPFSKTAAPQFFTLLCSGQQTGDYIAAARIVSRNLYYMSGYFLTIIVGAGIVGWICRAVIEQNNLGRKWPALRLKPAWYYLLRGDDYQGDGAVLVAVDMLSEVNNNPIVYSGIVTNFWFDEEGKVDVVFIQYATRQWMQKGDEEATEQFWMKLALEGLSSEAKTSLASERHGVVTAIPSDVFAVKFSEIKNINIQYLKTSS
jgi:hypothetical protein